MAFGFVKKIFSFGRKQVEEVPAEGAPRESQPLDDEKAGVAAEQAVSSAERSQAADSTVAEAGPAQPREISSAPETPKAEPESAPSPRPEPAPESVSPVPPSTPAPSPEPAPAPEPAPTPEPDPVPQPEPSPVPAPEPTPEPAPEPAQPPQEVPPAPAPTRPEPVEPIRPPVEVPPAPEPAQPAPGPAPIEPPAPPVEVPPPATPNEPAPLSPEIPPHAEAAPASPVESEQRVEPIASPIEGDAEIAPTSPPEAGEDGAEPTTSPLSGDRAEGAGERIETEPPARITVARSVERKVEPAPEPAQPAPRASWLQRLRQGLSRSSRELGSSIAGIVTRRRLDEDTLQDLEDVLIRADLGVETAMRITDALSSGRFGRDISDAEVRGVMAAEIEKVLAPVAQALELDLTHKPHVILVVGVNGTGKTTTIGKLAAKLTQGGLSVMLAAGDTFRAAAIEQLKIWGERTGSPVVSSRPGADAAGLAFDAFQKAKAAGTDVLIIDTAGRLQNKAELMAELEKIVRVLGKLDPEAPHTVLQTLDATTGQNALNQVEIFRNVAGVNGLVMTKLDGTARGGILVAIAAKTRLPVYFIGVGEQVDDLEPFSAGDFAKAIAGVE